MYEWQISYGFSDEEVGESDHPGYVKGAVCEPMWQYKTLAIWFPTDILKRDPVDVQTMVVHELLHGIVNPMREEELSYNQEEYVVTSLEKAVLGAFSAGCEQGRGV